MPSENKDSILQVNIAPTDTTLADLISALEMVSVRKLPNTVRAIKVAVRTLEYTWKSYAMGAKIPGTAIQLKGVKGAYAKSIKSKTTKLGGLVYSDSPYALEIEDGSEAKDLKKTIPFGPKSRMGKNGPYNIVPFRHGTPGSLNAPIPKTVYKMILKKIQMEELKKTSVRKQKTESTNAAGEIVQRRSYKWGGKVTGTGFPNLEGMVVMNVPSSKQENRSAYLTFRVITANKPKVDRSKKGWENSWIVPAKEGLHITKHVVANTRDIISEIIRAGITFDLTP